MLRAPVPLALVVLVAGCLSMPPVSDLTAATLDEPAAAARLPMPDFDFTAAIDATHGGRPQLHAVAALHEGSFGLDLVAFDPLTKPLAGDAPGASDSAYAAVDTWETWLCVAHWAGSGGFGGGVTIVDIADPTHPVVVSSVASGMLNADCSFTADGEFLFLGAYLGAHNNPAGLPPPADVVANGVLVYDVSDKANPTFLFHDAQGVRGGTTDAYHNQWVATIGGEDYVFQTYTGNILRFDRDALKLEMVSKLEHSQHDYWVGEHPITGDWVAVTGAGAGTAVFDVNDPTAPTLLGVWDAPEGYAGWHRQWPVDVLVDGRALIVVAGETHSGGTEPYAVLDWTDPRDITMVGEWSIPGQPVSTGTYAGGFLTYSPHEFEVWNGYVATGNYHGGVWLFDVATALRAQDPVTLAYYLPTALPQANGGTTNLPFTQNPSVWGAYFDDRGYVYATDWASGLYVLAFDGTET